MVNLIYDTFLEIAKHLPYPNLINACMSNKTWYNLCQQPNFWTDLIIRRYHLNVPEATKEDYIFLEEMYNYTTYHIPYESIEERQDSLLTDLANLGDKEEYAIYRKNLLHSLEEDNLIEYVRREKKVVDKIYRITLDLIDLLRHDEIKAWLSQEPLISFRISGDVIDDHPLLEGKIITAHTLSGVILEFNRLLRNFNEYGDYLSNLVMDSSPKDEAKEIYTYLLSNVLDPEETFLFPI